MYAAADRLTVLPPTLELRVLPRVLSDRARLAGRRLCGPAAARARAARHSARQLGEELDGAEMVDAAARERYY